MKREIEFRFYGVFDEDPKPKMLYGDVFAFSKYAPINDQFANANCATMQYTGLKDKNGTKIYEGDILKHSGDRTMIVDWSTTYASFVLNGDGWAFLHWFGESCSPEDCVVLGNIHENPELI